jgi:hypothetical protein
MTGPKISAAPLPPAQQLQRALDELGVQVTTKPTRFLRRHKNREPSAPELAGILHGFTELCLFGLDAATQPAEHGLAMHGYSQALGGSDAEFVAATGLKLSMLAELLAGGADRRAVPRFATLLAAGILAKAAGHLAMSAAGDDQFDLATVAQTVEQAVPHLHNLARRHPPPTAPASD